MKKFLLKNHEGFTLLEVVVSLGLIIMVFGGVTGLALLSAESERSSKNNLIAAYLAKEAQNLVRYKRDLNYISAVSPFNSIAIETDNTNYNFTIDYNLGIASASSSDVKEAAVLDIVNDFYDQEMGTDTIFHRLVTTTYHAASGPLPARIDVLVEVYWKQDNKSDIYSLTSELTDWRVPGGGDNCTVITDECADSCVVGDTCGGGVVIDATNNIVASPSNCQNGTCDDTGDITSFKWDYDTPYQTNAVDMDNGENNIAILDPANNARFEAAGVCDSVSVNNFSDWYLPADNELVSLHTAYYNSQISGMVNKEYWSSTENTTGAGDSNAGYYQMCPDPSCSIDTNGLSKWSGYFVRCVRRY